MNAHGDMFKRRALSDWLISYMDDNIETLQRELNEVHTQVRVHLETIKTKDRVIQALEKKAKAVQAGVTK